MDNILVSFAAIGLRGGMFLEFVLFVSRLDTLSEFDPPHPFLHLICIMYLCYRHFALYNFCPHLCKSLTNNSLTIYSILFLINK